MNRLRILTTVMALCAGLLLTTCTVGEPTAENPIIEPAPTATVETDTVIVLPEISAEPTQTATPETISESESTDAPELLFTYSDTVMLAKTVWGEARGCTPEEQRLVVWTILQRVDADNWPDTIQEVITQKSQFAGYRESNPTDADIYALCHEVLVDWSQGVEPLTHEIYAPTLPYYFFDGDGQNNWFREMWR